MDLSIFQQQLEKKLDKYDVAYVEIAKSSLDQLYTYLGNYIITEKSIDLRLGRFFDLEDLNDPYSQVEETYYLVVDGKKIPVDPIKTSALISYNKERMCIINREGGSTSYRTTFGRKVDAYIIRSMDYDEEIAAMKAKIKEFGLDKEALDLDEIISHLEEMNIAIRNANESDLRLVLLKLSSIEDLEKSP